MNTEQERDELIAEIARLIDRKIQDHEVRVGLVSGAIGLVFLGVVAFLLWKMYCLTN